MKDDIEDEETPPRAGLYEVKDELPMKTPALQNQNAIGHKMHHTPATIFQKTVMQKVPEVIGQDIESKIKVEMSNKFLTKMRKAKNNKKK